MLRNGLHLQYASGYNTIIQTTLPSRKYPVGELLCQIFQGEILDDIGRLFRNALSVYPLWDEPFGQDAIEKAEEYALTALLRADCIPARQLAQGSFVRIVEHYRSLDEKSRDELLLEERHRIASHDMPFKDVGWETLGQFLALCYNNYWIDLENAVLFFRAMATKQASPENQAARRDFRDLCSRLNLESVMPGTARSTAYDEETDSFEYRFVFNSFLEFVVFEASHLNESPKKIARCQNPDCRKFFTAYRSSAKYCGFPSPQDADRPCNELYPQLNYRTKQKTDAVAHLKRNAECRLRMDRRRHPECADEIARLLSCLQIEGQQKADAVLEGRMTTSQYEAWLKSLKRKKEIFE